MKSLTLYEVSQTYLHALEALTDPEADIPTDTIRDTMEALEGELQDKAVNVAKYIRNMETQAQAIKAAETDMAKRRKTLETRAIKMKEYLKEHMQRTGIKKIPSPWFVISVQKNPASVYVHDEQKIPGDYKNEQTIISVDKAALKIILKAGQVVPGAELVNGTRLAIK